MTAFSNDQHDDQGVTTVIPKKEREQQQQAQRQPRYNVILWDSDDHTYDYVETMLRQLFGHKKEKCHELAQTVDNEGKVIVLTTTKEHAELKRDQIHAYGKDEHIKDSKGSMYSTIEPVE